MNAVFQFVWIAFFIVSFFSTSSRRIRKKDMTKELNRLLNKDYDFRVRPSYGDGPLMIGLNIDFLSLNKVSESTMDYSITLHLYQTWKDKRLIFKRRKMKKINLTLANEAIDNFWLPDTCFHNDKNSFVHTVTCKNNLLKIRADGKVFYGMRVTPHLSCLMNLMQFPMDKQTCFFEVESYGYTTSDLQYFLQGEAKNAITGLEELHHSEFEVLSIDTSVRNISLNTGVYSRVAIKLKMVRKTVHYILLIYVPCASITIVSWLSFWIDDSETSARATLGITSILTIITIGINNRNTLPKISYLSALDVYCLACFTFVLLSFTEFVLVNWFIIEKSRIKNGDQQLIDSPATASKRIKQRRAKRKLIKEEPKSNPLDECRRFSLNSFGTTDSTKKINVIDRVAQILFPVAFVVFNLYYFVYLRFF